MTKKTIILTLLVFILALFARVYLMSIKQGLHSDETFIIINSKNNTYGFSRNFETNKIYTVLSLKEAEYKAHNDLKSIIKSIKKLRVDNKDKLSPPVYTYLVRLTQINVGELDIQTTVNRALYLNLLIFIMSFFVMFKLLNTLDFDKSFIPLALLIAFLNTGSLSTFLFIKPYILQELAYLFLTYVFAIEINKIKSAENIKNNFKSFLMPVFAVSFALLSGYFSVMYILFLTVIYIIFCVRNNKQKNILKLLSIFLISFILTLIVYPGFTDFLFINNPTTGKYVLDINDTITTLLSLFSSYLFYLPTLLIVVFCIGYNIVKKTNQKNYILYIICGLSFLTALLSLFFGLYKVFRYIAPTIALISIIIPYLISTIENKKIKNILATLIVLTYISGFFFSTVHESYDSDLNTGEAKPFIPNIENTFTNTNCTPLINSNVPLVVFTRQSWTINNILPYLKDSQKMTINHYTVNQKVKPPEHFIALIEYKDIEAPKGYKLINRFHCQRFEGYELKKEK